MPIRDHHDRSSQNIPLTPDERDMFRAIGKGQVTWGVRCCYEIISIIYSRGLSDLRGFFSSSEWAFLWHVMSRDLPDHCTMYCDTENLCRILLKPCNMGELAKHYGVNVVELRDRIYESFSPIHTFALWWRVQEFKYGDSAELGSWSEF